MPLATTATVRVYVYIHSYTLTDWVGRYIGTPLIQTPNETEEGVHISEVSLSQGLNCLQELGNWGQGARIKEVTSLQWCP